MIIYEVYGIPLPWAVKVSRGRLYNPRGLEKQQVVWQLKPQVNHVALSSPVQLDVTFYMPIPKSTSAIRKKQMLNGMIWPICKPDRSNMLKFIEDCLQDAEILSNDSIIVDGSTRKIYGLTPKTLIKIVDLNKLNDGSQHENN